MTLCFRRGDTPEHGLDLEKLLRSDSREKEKLERPCRVLIHNDDVTPIDYVASLLRRVFGLGWFRSLRITMRAHIVGVALVVVEPCAKAKEHVALAHQSARSDGHVHLRFSVEPTEG